ncbi:MAG: hypothetical protein ACP5F8_02150 [Candidatus Aenigmatarchaeota archaeon]
MRAFKNLVKNMYEDVKVTLASYIEDKKKLIISSTLIGASAVLNYLHINNWDKIAHFTRGYIDSDFFNNFLYYYPYISSKKKYIISASIPILASIAWEILELYIKWGVFDLDDIFAECVGIVPSLFYSYLMENRKSK